MEMGYALSHSRPFVVATMYNNHYLSLLQMPKIFNA